MKRLYKNWFFHNVIAHPLMYFAAHYDVELSKNIHDSTLPDSDLDYGKYPLTFGFMFAYGVFVFLVDTYEFIASIFSNLTF